MALDLQVRRLTTDPVSKGKAGPSSSKSTGGAENGGKGNLSQEAGTEARVSLQLQEADCNTATTAAPTGENHGGTIHDTAIPAAPSGKMAAQAAQWLRE